MEEEKKQEPKIFIINPEKGAKLSDINNVELLNEKWNQGIIKIRQLNEWKEFNISYFENNDLFIKPVTFYNSSLFNELFGFKEGESEFNENKIIKLFLE